MRDKAGSEVARQRSAEIVQAGTVQWSTAARGDDADAASHGSM